MGGKAATGGGGGGGGFASSLSADALERQVDPPSLELWRVYRAEFLQMQETLKAAQSSVAEAKRAAALSAAAAKLAGEGGGGGGAGASRLARPAKAEFRPQGTTSLSAGTRASAPSATSLKALRAANGAV